MLTEHTFDTGTVTINYAEGRSGGPPLVLLHGGSTRWQSSLPIIPELSRHWHLYAPDLRGHGKSGRTPGRYRLEHYVAEMAENLHLNDPTMLDAVIEFDKMHAGYDYERLFPMISCPVLIIQGSPAHGGMLTDEEVARALALLPCASVARMKAVGHPLH